MQKHTQTVNIIVI